MSSFPTTTSQRSITDKLLTISGQTWFIVAMLGQWIFAFYVAAFYGRSALANNFEKWTEMLPKGIVNGDPVGNAAIISHLFLAFFIIVLGPLQFIPWIRNKYRRFHKLNGRIYVTVGTLVSIAGLVMVWGRGTVGDLSQHIGISLDAILIMTFGYLVYKYARSGQFKKHEKWAWRFFMVVNAVWFFRVLLMFWVIVNQGPVGFDPEEFVGPFLSFLTFAQTLLPLLILEGYFRAKESSSRLAKLAMAIVMFLCVLITTAGIFTASMGMWLPNI